jgi:hypothetical protein
MSSCWTSSTGSWFTVVAWTSSKLPNQVGRSVYIEINEYMRQLMNVLAPSPRSFDLVSVVTFALLAGLLGAYIGQL